MPKINIMNFDDDENNKQGDNHYYQNDNDMLLSDNEPILEKNARRKNKANNSNKNRNSKNSNPKPPKKQKSKFSRFIKSFLITFSICVLFLAGSIYAYSKIFTDDFLSEFDSKNSKYTDTKPNSNLKEQYNFAIFGVDNESPVDPRTDFMVIGSYDTKTNKVKIMSVPRDTKAIMPAERIQFLKDNNIPILFPSSGRMKLNEVNHHATDEYGTSFLLAQLEEMFEVDFDFYVKINIDEFKYFVDAIGGVPFDVPQRMYYNDPTQDLYIDLQPGYQVLNGEQAEGVVRYRKADEQNPISKGYARGDLDRQEVQHNFMIALAKQVSSLTNLNKTLPAILTTTMNYCETNFKVTDVPDFLPFLTNFNPENIEMYSMPNEPSGDYVIPIYPDTTVLIDEIFYGNELLTPNVSSKGLEIEVLNGTYTSGLATKTKESLESRGFSISAIGDSDDKEEQTRIYVKDRAYGQDLQQYFKSAKIVYDPSLTCDIRIVLGLDEVE